MEQEGDRMTEELKPCPFCGSTNVEAVLDDSAPDDRKTDWWMISCLNCSAEFRNLYCDKKNVIKSWNMRVKE